MRGAFIVIMAIVVLIIGILTIKNMESETSKGVNRTESIQRAKDTKKIAEDASQKIKDAARHAGSANGD